MYFYCEIGPALSLKFANSPAVMLWLALGWFLFFKVTYTYWYVSTSDPGCPSDLRDKISATVDEIKYLQSNYSNDLAELRKYSGVWTENLTVVEEILRSSSECVCKKCDALKPLRTHHCSVCDRCVLLMDHHCMWTNNCIGLKNYKPFLQLNLFG